MMKRVIIEYAKLTPVLLKMLVNKYPNGYNYSDIISFKNAKGTTIKAVEIKTEDTLYLVKISSQLEKTLEDYDEDSNDDYNHNSDFIEDID